MHVFTFFHKVRFHWIFLRDCTVGLPEESLEGIRVGSCQHHWYLGHNGVCLLDRLRNSHVIGVICFFPCNRQESVSKGFQKNKKIKTENKFYIVFLRKTGEV